MATAKAPPAVKNRKRKLPISAEAATALNELTSSVLGTAPPPPPVRTKRSHAANAPPAAAALAPPSDYDKDPVFLQLDLMWAFRSIFNSFSRALPDELIFDLEKANGLVTRMLTMQRTAYTHIFLYPCAFSTFHVENDTSFMLPRKSLVGDIKNERNDDAMQIAIEAKKENCSIVIGGIDGRKIRRITLKLLDLDETRPALVTGVDWDVVFWMDAKTLENAVTRTATGVDEVALTFSMNEFLISSKRDQGDKEQPLKVTDMRGGGGESPGAVAVATGTAVVTEFKGDLKVPFAYAYLSEIIGSDLGPAVEVSLCKRMIRLRYEIAWDKCKYAQGPDQPAVVGNLEFILAARYGDDIAAEQAEEEEKAHLDEVRRQETVPEAPPPVEEETWGIDEEGAKDIEQDRQIMETNVAMFRSEHHLDDVSGDGDDETKEEEEAVIVGEDDATETAAKKAVEDEPEDDGTFNAFGPVTEDELFL